MVPNVEVPVPVPVIDAVPLVNGKGIEEDTGFVPYVAKLVLS